jgi:hypothetical protein
MALHESFGHMQPKLWAKEGPIRRFTKSQESARSRRALGECNMTLKSSRQELQHWFRPRPDRRSGRKAMTIQSPGNPNRDNFGTSFWESQDKKPFGCSLRGVTHSILYGGRWWLPPSPSRGESSESVLLVACPNTQSDPECGLTTLWLVFDAGSSKWIDCPSS